MGPACLYDRSKNQSPKLCNSHDHIRTVAVPPCSAPNQPWLVSSFQSRLLPFLSQFLGSDRELVRHENFTSNHPTSSRRTAFPPSFLSVHRPDLCYEYSKTVRSVPTSKLETLTLCHRFPFKPNSRSENPSSQ